MKFDFIYFDSGGTIYGIFDGDDPSPAELKKSALLRSQALLHSYGYNYQIVDEHETLENAVQHCNNFYGEMKYTFYQQLQKFFELLKIDLADEIIVCLSDAFAGPRFGSWVYSGTKEAFKELNTAGIGLGIIANTIWSSYNMDRAFAGVGLLPYLKHRVYSGNVQCAKPEMEIYSYAEDLAQLQGKRVLYVGNDIEKDIQAASAFGWSTAFRCSEKIPSSDGLADLDFDDINDLTRYCLSDT
ncbi:MAG: HAD hydrolase-like protein [Planctomycetes bacterium]|nr:HAD hydrolase-like protein [Planctomycetota bacterium]